MKALVALLSLFVISFSTNAQLIFINKNKDAVILKFEIVGNKTLIYKTSSEPTYVLNETPKLISNEDMRSNYAMNVKIDAIEFEIRYTLYRQTNKYIGSVKSGVLQDKSKSYKFITEYFENNP